MFLKGERGYEGGLAGFHKPYFIRIRAGDGNPAGRNPYLMLIQTDFTTREFNIPAKISA